MLKVQNLTKEFKTVTAVNNLSFTVEPGKIFGVLGPNGAGKTTTLRTILNIIKPTSGSITYNGIKTNRNFTNITGYLPEERGLYKKSNVTDVLVYFAELKNLKKSEASARAKKWLTRLEIESYANKKIEELSKGNQQKIQFISAIIHDPEILILDEPFSGFDPLNQEMVKELLSEFLKQDKLIIFSTHLMEIAEQLCSEIILLHKGKEILKGSITEIKSRFSECRYRLYYDGNVENIKDVKGIVGTQLNNSYLDIFISPDVKMSEILKDLLNKVAINQFFKVEPSLYEIFLESIKEENR